MTLPPPCQATSLPGVTLVGTRTRSVYDNGHQRWACTVPSGPGDGAAVCYAGGMPCPCMSHLAGHDYGDEDRS